MANYVITGGCGFVGAHLARLLVRRRHAVRIVDDLSNGNRENMPDEAQLVVGNVLDTDLMRQALEGADGCFHLAGEPSIEKTQNDLIDGNRTNLGGTLSVMQAAKRENAPPCPVVWASSAAIYGDVATIPIDEDAQIAPRSAYGVDQYACELHGQVAAQLYSTANTGLRFFNIYGPHRETNSPYSDVVTAIAHNMLFEQTIDIYGDGDQVRDFVYIDDAVNACVAAMIHQHIMLAEDGGAQAQIFNVCSGRGVSINRLIGTMAILLDINPVTRHLPSRIVDIKRSVGSAEKMKKLLGVTPDTSLREGLKRTIDSMKTKLIQSAMAKKVA